MGTIFTTIEALEAAIDAVAEALEADPKSRPLRDKLARLLADHTDQMNKAIYG